MNKICLVITEKGEAASALRYLKLSAEGVVAVAVGGRELAEDATRTAGSVKWIDTHGAPCESFAKAAAERIKALSPAAVVGIASAGTRAVIGYASQLLCAPVVPNLVSVTVGEDALRVEHMIYSDKMIETLEMPLCSGLLINPFSAAAVELEGDIAPDKIEQLDAQGEGGIEVVSSEALSTSLLQAADRIVGVGLGAANDALYPQVQELATLIGAELGCSMPVYNELNLMPHERYIGISGMKIAPKLYLALGISGTSQHCAGVRNAKTIVCINKDPKALFFDNSDYGIVGDLNEVLPELIAALK